MIRIYPTSHIEVFIKDKDEYEEFLDHLNVRHLMAEGKIKIIQAMEEAWESMEKATTNSSSRSKS